MDRYPTEEELQVIKEWDVTKQGVKPLMEFVKSIWKYEDRCHIYRGKRHLFNDKAVKIYLSTGGWSGNEEILSALRANTMFWMMYWWKSQRGGHYWFEIPVRFW